MRGYFRAAAGTATLFACGVFAAAALAGDRAGDIVSTLAGGGDHVTICHALGNGGFVEISPSASGVWHGHLDAAHGGQGADGADVIPPFRYGEATYSQNWNEAGQALLANHCRPVATGTTGGTDTTAQTTTVELTTTVVTTSVTATTAATAPAATTPPATTSTTVTAPRRPPRCRLSTARRRLATGRSTTLLVYARAGAAPVRGVRLVLSGRGVARQTRTTNRAGLARFVVRASRPRVKVTIRGSSGCGQLTLVTTARRGVLGRTRDRRARHPHFTG